MGTAYKRIRNDAIQSREQIKWVNSIDIGGLTYRSWNSSWLVKQLRPLTLQRDNLVWGREKMCWHTSERSDTHRHHYTKSESYIQKIRFRQIDEAMEYY